MVRNEWIKTIALILLGIAIGHLFYPNPQVQAFLYSVFALKLWGVPMDIIIYAVIGVAICIFLWRLERSERKNRSSGNRQILKSKIPEGQQQIDDLIKSMNDLVNEIRIDRKEREQGDRSGSK